MSDPQGTPPDFDTDYSAEHALRTTVEQAIDIVDAAKRDGAPQDVWVPALRRLLRGGLVAADALNGEDDD